MSTFFMEESSYKAARAKLVKLREESKLLKDVHGSIKEEKLKKNADIDQNFGANDAEPKQFQDVVNAISTCFKTIELSGMRRSTETELRRELQEIQQRFELYVKTRSKIRLKEANEWANLVEAAEVKGRQEIERKARDLVRRAACERDEARAATLRIESFTAQCIASAALAAQIQRYAAETSTCQIHQLETEINQLQAKSIANRAQLQDETSAKEEAISKLQTQNLHLNNELHQVNNQLQKAYADRDSAIFHKDSIGRAHQLDKDTFVKEKDAWQRKQQIDLEQLDAKVRKLLGSRDQIISGLKKSLLKLTSERDHLRGLLSDLDRNLQSCD